MIKRVCEVGVDRRRFIVTVTVCAVLLGLLATQANAAVATTADNGSDNLPFDFDYVAPVTWSVGNSGSYAGIASTVTGVEGGGGDFLGTTMSILRGVNDSGSVATVSLAWRTRIPIEVSYEGFTPLPMRWGDPTSQVALGWDLYNNLSDVVDIHGVTGPYVLQSTYSDNEIYYDPLLTGTWSEERFAEIGRIYLGWLEEVKADGELPNYYEWRNATAMNTFTGTNPVLNFQGTFDEFLASIGGASNFDYSVYMGSYGVDTGDNVVWAVLNHNSVFGVVPEPSTVAILGLGMLLIRRKK